MSTSTLASSAAYSTCIPVRGRRAQSLRCIVLSRVLPKAACTTDASP